MYKTLSTVTDLSLEVNVPDKINYLYKRVKQNIFHIKACM